MKDHDELLFPEDLWSDDEENSTVYETDLKHEPDSWWPEIEVKNPGACYLGFNKKGEIDGEFEGRNIVTTLAQMFEDQVENPEGPDYAEFRSLVRALFSSSRTKAWQLKSHELFTLLLGRSASLTIMKSIVITEIIAREQSLISWNITMIKRVFQWLLLDPSVAIDAEFRSIEVPGKMKHRKPQTVCFFGRGLSDPLFQLKDKQFCDALKAAAPLWISRKLSCKTRFERIRLLHYFNSFPLTSEDLTATVIFTARQLLTSGNIDSKLDILFPEEERTRTSQSHPRLFPKWLNEISPESTLLGFLLPSELISCFAISDVHFTKVSKMKKAVHSLEIAFRLQTMRDRGIKWLTKASRLKKDLFRCLFSIIAFCGIPELFLIVIEYIQENMKIYNLAEDAFLTDIEDREQFKLQKCLVLLPGESSKESQTTSISFFSSPLVASFFCGEGAAARWILENQQVDLQADCWKTFLKRLKSSKMYSSPQVKKNVKAVLSEIDNIQ